jgi:tRNA-Thr(GGU) m(6)t(6)A37 methyltransferase TsaA
MAAAAAVQAELQASVQTLFDQLCRQAVFVARRADDSTATPPLPPLPSAGMAVLQTPRLQQLLRTGGGAGSAALAAASSARSVRPVSAGAADFTCRTLIALVHEYRKAFQQQSQHSEQLQSSSAAAAAAPAVDVDVPATLAAWSELLATQLRCTLPTTVQQTESPAAGLLRGVRVDACAGYVNFTLTDDSRQRMLAASRTGSPHAPGSTAAAVSSSSALSARLPPSTSRIGVDGGGASSSLGVGYTMHALGSFRSVFVEKHGTPRQGAFVSAARAVFTLRSDLPPSSLDGLREYSHVWLLFVFHQNSQLQDSAADGPALFEAAKVAPPRLKGKRVGLFATRAPHRPNPIGLSLAKVERVEGRQIHLSAVDLVDHTPIIDIKPVHPADAPAHAHREGTTDGAASASAAAAALSSASAAPLSSVPAFHVPSWLHTVDPSPLRVAWTAAAEAELDAACAAGLDFYSASDLPVLRRLVECVLSADPRSVHSTHAHSRGVFGVALDRIDVHFVLVAQPTAAVAGSSAEAEQTVEDQEAAVCAASVDPLKDSSTALTALVFAVRHFAVGAPRPRMRTREWLAAVLPHAEAATREWSAKQQQPPQPQLHFLSVPPLGTGVV